MTFSEFIKIFAKHGAIGLVAGVLLWFTIGVAIAGDETTQKKQDEILLLQHTQALTNDRMLDLQGQMIMLQEKVLLVQRIQCVNDATTAFSRSECMREK